VTYKTQRVIISEALRQPVLFCLLSFLLKYASLIYSIAGKHNFLKRKTELRNSTHAPAGSQTTFICVTIEHIVIFRRCTRHHRRSYPLASALNVSLVCCSNGGEESFGKKELPPKACTGGESNPVPPCHEASWKLLRRVCYTPPLLMAISLNPVKCESLGESVEFQRSEYASVGENFRPFLKT
jgi:hypothetical protein